MIRTMKIKLFISKDLIEKSYKNYIPVLQDLRKAIYDDETLRILTERGHVVIHSSLGYPIAQYKETGISIGIEPVNPSIREDLSLGYIVKVRDGKAPQEINGFLNWSLPRAISIFKGHISSYASNKSRML